MTELQYLGPVDLTQYFVKSYTFSDADEYLNNSIYGNKGIQVDFKFSRRLLNQVLTVFMPTVIIILILIWAVCTFLQIFSLSRLPLSSFPSAQAFLG